ncbi:MAG TPA: hypothetical protein VFV00_12895 [Acidimicrobiales bacterium]|nr:hypothetical protein [Acidimicrobiales bacterium]
MIELADHPATKRIAFAVIAAVLFAGIVAAATKSDDGNVGEGRLTAHGRAAVTDVNGARREVSGVVALHSGDTVEAIDGAMTIDLPDGSTIEGRPAFKRSAATRVKVARPAELMDGDLLVVAKNGTDLVAAGNRLHLDAAHGSPNAMRASRSLAVDASVYRGQAAFDSAGQVRIIPALRALDVSVLGRPPMDFAPLALDENDAWDRRFLGDAIDLDHTLDSYIQSSVTLGTANATTPAYYRSLVPSLANESGLTADLLASSPHSPIDTIIGGAIAGLGHQGDFADRWRRVFAFKDAGARWGLVALDQQVEGAALLREVQSALNTAPLSFAAARRPAGATPTTGPTSTTGPTTTTPTGAGPTTQPPPTSPTTPPPTVPSPTLPPPTLPTLPPPTTPTVPQVPQTGDPVVDGVVNSVNQLLGAVVGQPPSS